MKKLIYYILIAVIQISCDNTPVKSPLDLFKDKRMIPEKECFFERDSLAQIETLLCNDSSLIVFDYHSSNSFTLFDLHSGKYIRRFGAIGNGPGEIPLGSYGFLSKNDFVVYYTHTGLVTKFDIDSLRNGISSSPNVLCHYKIPEAQFSRIIPINDTVFVGGGTYKSTYQFLLFDSNNSILDYGIEIYNADNQSYNEYHKYLSNQGVFTKSPDKNKFVYALNNSSNIDFFEIVDSKIQLIRSIRIRDPQNKPMSDGPFNGVIPDRDCGIGYIDLTVTDKYVYALYTDKKMVDDRGKGNSFSSNVILVFDWNGNPVEILQLNQEVYYIAVNEKRNLMYAAFRYEDGGWGITAYGL